MIQRNQPQAAAWRVWELGKFAHPTSEQTEQKPKTKSERNRVRRANGCSMAGGGRPAQSVPFRVCSADRMCDS
jgi:hypothetical protein